MNFPSQIFFNDINHGYRAAILKKNSLWLLPFYMVVATSFCYKKVRRTMRIAIVSNLLKSISLTSKCLYGFSPTETGSNTSGSLPYISARLFPSRNL